MVSVLAHKTPTARAVPVLSPKYALSKIRKYGVEIERLEATATESRARITSKDEKLLFELYRLAHSTKDQATNARVIGIAARVQMNDNQYINGILKEQKREYLTIEDERTLLRGLKCAIITGSLEVYRRIRTFIGHARAREVTIANSLISFDKGQYSLRMEDMLLRLRRQAIAQGNQQFCRKIESYFSYVVEKAKPKAIESMAQYPGRSEIEASLEAALLRFYRLAIIAGEDKIAESLQKYFIVKYERRVNRIVNRVIRLGIPEESREDLESAGNLGIVLAMNKFNRNYDGRFYNYAKQWINALVKKTIPEILDGPVLPYEAGLLVTSVEKTIRLFRLTTDQEPSTTQIAEYLGVNESSVSVVMNRPRFVRLKSTKDDEDEGRCLEDLPDVSQKTHTEHASDNQRAERLYRALDRMDPRKREILILRYGMVGYDSELDLVLPRLMKQSTSNAYIGKKGEEGVEMDGASLASIGRRMNLSRERVNQLFKIAHRELTELVSRDLTAENSENI